MSFRILSLLTTLFCVSLVASAHEKPIQPPQGNLPADTIVLQRPKSLKYTKIETNGDGSIYIEKPQVYYAGAWRYILSYMEKQSISVHYGPGRSSTYTEDSICQALNKNLEARHTKTKVFALSTSEDGLVTLDRDNSKLRVLKLTSGPNTDPTLSYHIYHWVICEFKN